MQRMETKLTLIGAGPGDKDLITWKGIKALQAANVVLYDALVNRDLLDFSNNEAIKIYVGKRGGKASFSQDKINQLIVSYGLIYGNVVRLKGGDPFIFGRGREEIEFAEKNGMSTEVIPGISSATGLTAVNNISLTKRGVADGFWVLTATKMKGALNPDIRLAASSNSTLVILMGVSKLKEIVAIYQEQGKGDIPFYIIQEGSTPNEKIVSSTANNIIEYANINELRAPAIIVVGEVLRENIRDRIDFELINQLN
jgi:uroporphyrin-III C-methyltransferase